MSYSTSVQQTIYAVKEIIKNADSEMIATVSKMIVLSFEKKQYSLICGTARAMNPSCATRRNHKITFGEKNVDLHYWKNNVDVLLTEKSGMF